MLHNRIPIELPPPAELTAEHIHEAGISQGTVLELATHSLYALRAKGSRPFPPQHWLFDYDLATVTGTFSDTVEEALRIPREVASNRHLRLMAENDYETIPTLLLRNAARIMDDDGLRTPFASIPLVGEKRYTGQIQIPLSSIVGPIHRITPL